MNKIDKFYEVKNLLRCPRCGKKIRFHGGGLVCKKEHRFDISSKGYVNFLQENRALKGYDKNFFACRSRFLQAGYYSHILKAVEEQVKAAYEAEENRRDDENETCFAAVDAGCGEGYYSTGICRELSKTAKEGRLPFQMLAFDISADGIRQCTRSSQPVKWMVADITNIPVKDRAVHCILDIFTPANYKEFDRILKPGGMAVKVVPGKNHLIQLRKAAAPLLRNKEYSNEEVLDYFDRHFQREEKIPVSRTLPLSEDLLSDLVAMTPLLFDADKSRLNLEGVTEITIEGELLIGRKPL